MIGHPDIHLAYPLGPPGPDDHEGELTDGVRFVFRYRHGYAHLGLGRYRDDAEQDARRRPEWGIGNFGEQRFASPQERDLVFAGMLRARRAAADYPRISAVDTGSQIWPANWNTLGVTADGDAFSTANARVVAYDGNVFNVPAGAVVMREPNGVVRYVTPETAHDVVREAAVRAESMVIRDADGSVRFRPRDPGNEPPLHRPGRPDTCECRSCVAVRARMAALGDNRAGRRHPGDRR